MAFIVIICRYFFLQAAGLDGVEKAQSADGNNLRGVLGHVERHLLTKKNLFQDRADGEFSVTRLADFLKLSVAIFNEKVG